jgi:hypothetical protein
MGIYTYVDIAVSASGDMALGQNRDFQLTEASGVLKQDIAFRLRTNPGEFYVHQDVGAGLDELIGEPNTRENAKIGEEKIYHSLISDGFIQSRDLYVKGVPVSNESVFYYTFVNSGFDQINVSPDVIFSQIEGMKNIPGGQNVV